MSLLVNRTGKDNRPVPLKVTRKLGTIPYVSGGQQSFDIMREEILLRLFLRLKFTITSGASAMVGPLDMALARLFKRIEVVAGGRDTFINVSGATLAKRHFYENRVHAYGVDSTFVLTGTNTVTNYDVVLPITFMLPNGRREDDCGLDTRGLSQLSAMVSWGTISDLVATPNGAALSNVSCSVEGEYLINVPADKTYLVRSLISVEKELTGSSDNFDLIMDGGTGLIYRNLMVMTTADNVAVDTILSTATGEIRLECGSFVELKQDPIVIKAQNRAMLKDTPLTGVYWLDLQHLGQFTSSVNTVGLPTDWKAYFNATKVSGTNMISVSQEAVRTLKLS